jgi:hypothetical protein
MQEVTGRHESGRSPDLGQGPWLIEAERQDRKRHVLFGVHNEPSENASPGPRALPEHE